MDILTYAGNLENLKSIEHKENYTFVKCDICDIKKVKTIFKDYLIDSVIHLAAESHVDNSIKSPGQFIHSNIIGTYNILRSINKNIFSIYQIVSGTPHSNYCSGILNYLNKQYKQCNIIHYIYNDN